MDNTKSSIICGTDQEKTRSSRVSQALIITAATIIILAGIKLSSVLVGPMLLALFIAIILLVPLRWLQAHGCPNFLSYPIVLGFTIALFAGVTYFVGQTLNDEVRKIPDYRDQFVEKYAALEAQIEQYVERLGFVIGELGQRIPLDEEEHFEEPTPDEPASPNPVTPEIPPIALEPETTNESGKTDESSESNENETDTDTDESGEIEKDPVDVLEIGEVFVRIGVTDQQDSLPIALNPSVVAYWIARVMHYLQGVLGGAFLVLLFTIFMLFEAVHFPRKVNRAFGADGPLNIGHLHHIAEEIRRYLFLKTLSNLMSASAALFVYWMFGVPGALFWGIIAFFMYYIPNLGGTLAAVIPGLLIFMMADIYTVLFYAVCLLTVECAIAYGIEPKLLGHGLRLSTLVIILSLFFWGFLLGPIGLFLAAPLTVMIKIVLQAFPETRWCAIFLDGGRE